MRLGSLSLLLQRRHILLHRDRQLRSVPFRQLPRARYNSSLAGTAGIQRQPSAKPSARTSLQDTATGCSSELPLLLLAQLVSAPRLRLVLDNNDLWRSFVELLLQLLHIQSQLGMADS